MKLKIMILLLCVLFSRYFAVGSYLVSEFRLYAEMSTIERTKYLLSFLESPEQDRQNILKNFRQSENSEFANGLINLRNPLGSALSQRVLSESVAVLKTASLIN